MSDPLLKINFDPERTLQDQIKEHIVELILSGHFPVLDPLPSSRILAKKLGVSRNTALLIYESLVESGYIISLPRKGYFIAQAYHRTEQICSQTVHIKNSIPPNWQTRLRKKPSNEKNIVKPNDWHEYEYPFIFGQVQSEYFPLKQWRECSRQFLSSTWSKYWIHDQFDLDDAMLINQIKTRLLPQRGIYAESSEILITLGTQNSLFLISNLLCDNSKTIALENPGFRDAHNIFRTFGANIHLQPVDQDGIIVDSSLHNCDYLYLTPSHQVPTGAALPESRRTELLSMANEKDLVLIEDDYDSEINVQNNPVPALKAFDTSNRVIYVGSLSKAIAPGLRLGFMVADEDFIAEARAQRRLMYRHPPANVQRQVALFLSQGHYDSYIRKIRQLCSQKEETIHAAIAKHMPNAINHTTVNGATAVWLQLPNHIDTDELSWRASKKSILIEPGSTHFLESDPPKNFLRLGFSAIPSHKIENGIIKLAQL